MSDVGELKRTFDQRWETLGLAETALAVAVDVTLRPPAGSELPPAAASPTPTPERRSAGSAWTRPDAGELPRISLAFATGPAPTASPDSTSRADLEVLGVIGEGGMGRVHAARQRSLDRDVAIKTLKSVPAADGIVGALLREAVITGRLEHPGIVPVHALGIDDHGAPVLVMKRVEGVEWRTLLANPSHAAWAGRGGDQLSEHLEILMHVCQAVHFAHSRGVAHCDIKPENVMLGEFGEVYLVDWGIAMRLDDPSTAFERNGVVGTPAYMAPELVSGGRVTPQTDVYLLGAVLHQVLTGRFRHEGKSVQEALLSAFCSEPLAYGADVPAELAALANRSTSRDPSERPGSALAFRHAIAEYLEHKGSITLSEGAAERLAALGRLLDERPSDQPPGDLRMAYRLVTESRFGFVQALKEWSANTAAQAGLAATIARGVELELRQGHAESAQALLQELAAPPAELVEAVTRARKAEARKRADEQRYRELAHDLDTSVAGRERTRALAGLSGATLAVAAFALSQPNPAKIRPQGLLTFAVVIFAVMLAGTVLWRKRLFENAFNRRAVALMLLSGLVLVVSRSIATWLDMPAPLVFLQDSLILAGIAAAASILMLRWLWLVTLVLLAGAVACIAMPGDSPAIFALMGVFLPPLCALAVWKHRVDEEREREEALPESLRAD